MIDPVAAEAGEEGEANCPNCQHSMRPREVSGFSVRACDNCGHLFMSQRVLAALVGEVPVAVPNLPKSRKKVACPLCGERMEDYLIDGEMVRICPGCERTLVGRMSVWRLGHGEGREKRRVAGFLFEFDVARNLERARRGERMANLVADIFVLYRDGILLTAITSTVHEGVDGEIVAGMMQAITDFVQTSFEHFTGGIGLDGIRFGDREIVFIRGEFLVVVLNLPEALEVRLRKHLTALIQQLETEHRMLLREWNGDMARTHEVVRQFHELFVPFAG